MIGRNQFPASSPCLHLCRNLNGMKKQYFIYLLFLSLFGLFLGFKAQGQMTLTVSMVTTPACSLDGSATATVTGGTPPYTYTFYGPAYYNGPSNTITGVPGGTYSLYVNDGFNNYGYANFTIAMPFTPTLTYTNDVCSAGIGTATATVTGGTPPFTYLWSNGQTVANATGLTAGTYAITITDANGCFISSQMDSSMYAYIQNSSPITGTTTSTGTTCANGTATVSGLTGGTAPYTYVWNTTPPQFTATATGLNSGSYYCLVTDAGGCTYNGYAYVNQLPNGLTGTTTSTPETCLQANGTATVTVSGGTAPYTYLWSNGATTQTITGLSYGGYSVTVTDANSCPKIKWVSVHRVEPLNLSFTTTAPNCSNANGSIACTVTGGTAPYTYQWSNGGTASSISGLSQGYYYVAVTDANGCTDYNSVHLTLSPSCYSNVSGRVVGDMNTNCVLDGGDFRVRNNVIDISGYWAVTDYNGDYQKDVLLSSAVVTQPFPQSYFAVACPISGNYTLPTMVSGSTYPGNDFYDQATSTVNDLSVSYYMTPARATTPQSVTIHYYNHGSTALNATVDFTHDALMTLLSGGSMTSYNLGTRTLTYNVGIVNPGQWGTLYCSFTIPSLTPLGTSYQHSAEIQPITIDATPTDNVYSYPGQVVAAYDPNAKSVFPDGLLTPGIDSMLTYTIQFQNTGNDTAFTVALRDSLDPGIDPFSIEILGASHNYIWEMDAPGYMEFRFENIMLPDSHINEAASHGWIMYRAKIKANLPLGTQIDNTASIYFDFNTPIVTNTTHNVFGAVAVDEGSQATAGFSFYPNPANDRVQVLLDENWNEDTQVNVMDLNGRALRQNNLLPSQSRTTILEVGDLPAGLYLIECTSGNHRLVKKLVIQ
jgi:uncharacterized repeat protein (TIGR01451 family)